MFPIPKDKSPLSAAPVLANNSGAEVPNPIKVAPIIDAGILSFSAICTADFTIRSAPLTKSINPAARPKRIIKMSI